MQGGSAASDLYSDSEESGSESEELTDDESYEDDYEDDYVTDGSDVELDDDLEHASNGSSRETVESGDDVLYENEVVTLLLHMRLHTVHINRDS